MRIAFDAALLHGDFSGVEQSILRLAGALDAHGRHDYDLFVPPSLDRRRLAVRRARVHTAGAPLRIRVLRLLWEQLRLPARALAAGADLLHAPGYLAPLRPGLPVVLTIYDVMALRQPRWCRTLNRLNYRLLLPPSIRRAAALIVPSDWVRRELRAALPHADVKVRVIPLGVGESFTAQPGAGDRAALDRLAVAPPYLLYAGNREPRKNLALLVRAFHLLRSRGRVRHRLVLAGSSGWGTDDLGDLIHRLGLEQEIVLTGYVPGADLPALYRQADLFVFPSLAEGFGLPPLEAMACGTPVVCSTAGALPEVVDTAAWTVEPTDPAALAGGMARVLETAQLRRRLSAAGRRRAARFTWRRAAEATERVYDSVRLDPRPGA